MKNIKNIYIFFWILENILKFFLDFIIFWIFLYFLVFWLYENFI